MKLANPGFNLIASFEKCELEAYLDEAGIPTIGYGHTDGVEMGMKITKAEAERIFRQDLKRFERGVNECLAGCDYPVNQNMFDALVAFSFNVGTGAFRLSTMLKKIRRGDMRGASQEFLKWNKVTVPKKDRKGNVMRDEDGKIIYEKKESKGLTRRRLAEKRLFDAPAL